MSFSAGFKPIQGELVKALVLGSMPGVASLEKHQYYAHSRNSFWPIMAEILAFDRNQSYDKRCEILKRHGFMLWDVIASARRKGSLDSAIESDGLQLNDFSFLQGRSDVPVFCNGAKAYNLFRSHVAKPLDLNNKVHSLPSTSPAYASMSFGDKLAHWRVLQSVAL